MNIESFCYFFSQLLGIDVFDVVFKKSGKCFDLNNNVIEDFDFQKNEIALAIPEINTIRINLDIAQGPIIIEAMAHEARHLFQYKAMQDPIVRERTEGDIDQWKKDFDSYRNVDCSTNIKSCELDAIAFADLIAEELLGKKVMYTNDLKRMKKEIKKEDIKNAMNEDVIQIIEMLKQLKCIH